MRCGGGERDLVLLHALADVCEPPAHLVGLDEPRVGVVKALECVGEVGLGVELAETLAHHGEEHGEVDARVGGVRRGLAGAGGEEVVEDGLRGGDACCCEGAGRGGRGRGGTYRGWQRSGGGRAR